MLTDDNFDKAYESSSNALKPTQAMIRAAAESIQLHSYMLIFSKIIRSSFTAMMVDSIVR